MDHQDIFSKKLTPKKKRFILLGVVGLIVLLIDLKLFFTIVFSIGAVWLVGKKLSSERDYKQKEKQTVTYFWNKKVRLGGWGRIVLLLVFVVSLVMLFSNDSNVSTQTQQNNFLGKTKNVLKSQEKRFGCENGKIENLAGVDLTGTKAIYKIIDGIRTNRVEYPVNIGKEEVMMEYCFGVANLSSEMGGLWITVKFLDEDKNVLAESDERVADIPGKRIKTVYGSEFVDAELANEITTILVGQRNDGY